MKRFYRSPQHSVMKTGNRIRTAWEKWSPKILGESARSIIYETIAHYYKIFIQCLMRYPAHNISWGWSLWYSQSLMFLSWHFQSFITSDCLFLCICLNTVLFNLSYACPFPSHSESYSSFGKNFFFFFLLSLSQYWNSNPKDGFSF